MTLDEWFEQWITTCKRHCRDTTLRTYRIQYERLGPELGWRKLSSLNLVILQEAFNHLKSDASGSDCRAVLIDMLNRAVESDLLVKNAAYGINPVLDNEDRKKKGFSVMKKSKFFYLSVNEHALKAPEPADAADFRAFRFF